MLDVKDDENVFDGMFRFMEKYDDEEGEEKIIILDIKQNLNVGSVRRLRNLANILINFVIELTTGKGDTMNNSLHKRYYWFFTCLSSRKN